MINRGAWNVSSKEWVKSRKDDWKRYESHLIKVKVFDVREIKYFKDYFIYGIEPKDRDSYSFDENVTLPLIIKCWLYPNNCFDEWEVIKSDVILNSFQPEYDIYESYNLLFHKADKCDYSTDNGYEEGFFLGNEEALVRFFCGEEGKPDAIVLDGFNTLGFCTGPGLVTCFLTGAINWLLCEYRPNSFWVYQYLFRNWSDFIMDNPGYFNGLDIDNPPSVDYENFNDDELVLLMRFNKVKSSLERFSGILDSGMKFDKVREAFILDVCSLLNSEGLPENFKKMWLHVRNS